MHTVASVPIFVNIVMLVWHAVIVVSCGEWRCLFESDLSRACI